MDLPQTFRRRGTSLLAGYPTIAHRWSAGAAGCELFVPAASAKGFDIAFTVSPAGVVLNWGRWHSPFEPDGEIEAFVEHLFGLLRDLLSPDMRIRELWAWPSPYRGYLESFDGARWSSEEEMGLIFWNYLGRRSQRIYSNSVLPGRMSAAEPGDNEAGRVSTALLRPCPTCVSRRDIALCSMPLKN